MSAKTTPTNVIRREPGPRSVLKASGAMLLATGTMLLLSGCAAGLALHASPPTAFKVDIATPTPANLSPPAAGGYSSHLAQITAEQNGAPLVVVASTPAPAPAVSIVRAAIQPAILRTSPSSLGASALPAATPNLFGSNALAIGHTPLDAKWRSVSHVVAGGAQAGEILAKVRGDNAAQAVEQVNAFVNHHIAFTDDARSGEADRWSNADETLRRGAGDCEDYAIAKLQILRSAGFDERDLYLVLVKDLVRRADHAILVVRLDGRFVVLDSNTDRIVSADAVQDYKPLMTFSGDRAWVHGYRAPEPQILLAANTTTAPAGETETASGGF